MKYKLFCRIFGHDFRKCVEIRYDYSVWERSNICRNCGLNKEECGFTVLGEQNG